MIALMCIGSLALAGYRTAWRDTFAVLEGHAGLPRRRLLPQLVGGLVAAVYVYVPLHELLHALGCVASGGRVTRIEIAPRFGGRLLARVSPLISAETEYAGRLAGFDVGGSSLRLLATDAAPYILTVLVGVPLLRRLRQRRHAWLVPAALLLALAPYLNLTGDYYEVGSVVVTGALAWLGWDWSALRSDDLARLAAALWRAPAAHGITSEASAVAAGCVVGASLVLAAVLAGGTYLVGTLLVAVSRAGPESNRPARPAPQAVRRT